MHIEMINVLIINIKERKRHKIWTLVTKGLERVKEK